ncbi:MAG: Veg family protein [Bacilli bacterium]|nr:Veg family protein [Bacilli bacterium]
MTISSVKKEMLEHLGDVVSIKYSLGRNKYEEYEAKIKELYDYIFLVDTDLGVKSFSYIDVITKVIRIDY